MATSMTSDEILAKYGAIMYDCEIVSAIPMKGEQRDPNLFYCNGWEDYEGMGISVIGVYDYFEQMYRVFLQDNMSDFKTLINSRQIIIGFNSKRFDDNLIKANSIPCSPEKSYDLWAEIAASLPVGQRSGYSLNNMLKANKLPVKTGLGSEAPMLAQTGQWGKLIDYCIHDVNRQVKLLRLACLDMMVNPVHGGLMTIKKPWERIKVETNGIF